MMTAEVNLSGPNGHQVIPLALLDPFIYHFRPTLEVMLTEATNCYQ